jgi:gas vesicle protein
MSDDPKITKAVDKLVMGMIIGGAVGSVLGMAVAPKGKIIKEKAIELKKEFIKEHNKEITEAKHMLKNKSKSLFSFIKKKLKQSK